MPDHVQLTLLNWDTKSVLALNKKLKVNWKFQFFTGAPFGGNYWGVSKFFFNKEALKGLTNVIFPVCGEYWGLEPHFLKNFKLPSS